MSRFRAVISRVCRMDAFLNFVELISKLVLVWFTVSHMELSIDVNSSFECGSYKVWRQRLSPSHYPAKTGVISYLDQISSIPNPHYSNQFYDK